jgi:hypothetical protein
MYIKTGDMLVDIMTKPLGGELFNRLSHAILGNHRFTCLNNRGAKESLAYSNMNVTLESVVSVLASLSFSNQGELVRTKHKGDCKACIYGPKGNQ